MNTIVAVAMFAVLVLTTACTTTGFAPGAGERVLDTTLKGAITGAVIGGGVGILGEVFRGPDHRDVVVVPGGYRGYSHGGYGHGGGQYSHIEMQQQWEEERRRQEAIWAERHHRH